jgi:hypothetical protein
MSWSYVVRRQVRCYRNEVDNMRQQEYDNHHDHYEHHDSYNHRKWHHTSTEATLSCSGGYAWPPAKTPQIVVSLPRSLAPPGNHTSPVSDWLVNDPNKYQQLCQQPVSK